MYIKKITRIAICSAALLLPGRMQAQHPATPRNILYTTWEQAGGGQALAATASWRATQYRIIREKTAQLPPATRKALLQEADKALDFTWPALTASLYREYKINGNRSNFEQVQAARRKVLSTLVAGELVEGKGKYLPQIVNALWMILEESTWVLPAHITAQKAGSGLPDPAEPVIDLVVGETAAALSWTQFLLHDQLDSVDPMVNKRITYELQHRVITPFLERQDFWWMGFKGGMVNNWNIWVNTNILQTALLVIPETDIRNRVIEKTIRSADNFLNAYPPDGGCDEGPTYWGHAGGKLIEMITWLQSASGHRLDWRKNELIHQIGAYIYKMHVDSSRFVNFADASASTIPPPHTVYWYGEAYNDPLLKGFAASLYRLSNKDTTEVKTASLPFFIYEVLTRDSLLATTPKAPYHAVNWLPDLQVVSLRSKAGTAKGLFFAAQGGHNAESHNHNDVGNFVLYMNGKPALLDVGVGTYTKQTFSADRYQLWYMQSQWHNCPTINGVQQLAGRQFAAREVQFTHTAARSVLRMDIAAAYPEAAAADSWQRIFTFTPATRSLQLEEIYRLRAWKEAFKLHFMTVLPVDTTTPGKLLLQGEGAQLVMTYDPALLEVLTEQQPVTDGRLTPVWGSTVTRITLRARQEKLSGKHQIRFVMQP
ncbi:heparinase II/III-family protein [Chitinophaga nivalis]|uniref:Heparinase II/III-family protein n=1 Tax=Chitinophaga nivalis TaxID=2991709 RepID=A0ABT3ISD9_9BACT|nr:heparinase II/III-family protein [Chitinophaga nivalis]MCW3463417.1 heparinase II/III-family protein [Chitinophaga nivalis]MCW3486893.1 heparinase II/III-family protein [Chitinophaga nivalis]